MSLLGTQYILMICHRKKKKSNFPKHTVVSKSILIISINYTMDCPPARGDNPRALASGLSYVQVDNPLYNLFIPPTLE